MEFKFNGFWWQSDLRLPAWAGFLDRATVELIFAPEGRDEGPMNPDEVALVAWVVQNHAWQQSALVTAVVEAFPEIRRQYFDAWEGFASEDDFPSVTTKDELAKVLRLEAVNVHQISKDGLPYVGYQFSCSWEEEHGFGVLMHGNRVVEIGDDQTSFLLWIAERDRDSDS